MHIFSGKNVLPPKSTELLPYAYDLDEQKTFSALDGSDFFTWFRSQE